MSEKGEMPEFPNVAGARTIADGDKERIAEAAWGQANGNRLAFQQLCAEHVRGEIDLFSDDPRAIRLRGASAGVGSDKLTATGGEVHDIGGTSSAAMPGAAVPGAASVPGGGYVAPPGSVTGSGTIEGA